MIGRHLFSGLVLLGGLEIFAQPTPPPAGADLACSNAAGAEKFTGTDAEGFVKIFNGKDLTGWWNNCKTEDAASDRAKGGIMRADPDKQAIYTMQRSNGGGSMLTTNQTWGNHEIIMETWPDWGNDAGLFHRTTADGRAYQTVIDYRSDNCIGGSYPQEMGYTFYNCAYTFTSEGVIGSGKKGDAKIDQSTFNWSKMWDPAGWNELRVKIYGNPPKHQAWMRKMGETQWFMVVDVTWPASYLTQYNMPATGHIALQIHYGNYWNKTGAGNWYRNIRLRELDNTGNPIIPTSVGKSGSDFQGALRATAGSLSGNLDRDYQVTIRDAAGRILDSFGAAKGLFRHELKGGREGVVFVDLRSGSTVTTKRFVIL